MKFIIKLICGTAVLAGLIVLYFVDESYNARQAQQKKENAVALYFNNKECIKFSMQNSHGTFTFQRDNFETPWQMIEPKNLLADQDAVNSALVMLRNISVQRELDFENKLDDYGLTSPALRFEVISKDKNTKVLSIGKNLGDSKESYHLPSMYAQAGGRSKILIVDNSSLSQFNEQDYSHFRTKNIAQFKAPQVAQFSLETQTEKIEASLKENKWFITSPKPTPGDNTFIFQYLQLFQELAADHVIESPSDKIFKSESINLKNPTASISFQDENGKVLQKLSFYMTKTGIFINMPDGAFGKINMERWTDLLPKFKYFRNRSLMLGTNVQCSPELQNLTADDLIDNATKNDLQKYGFKKPIRKLTCSIEAKNDSQTDSKNTANEQNLEILIGNRVPLDEKNVYVKRSDSDTVYIVNGDLLSKLAQPNSL